jgi:hypothetical protein
VESSLRHRLSDNYTYLIICTVAHMTGEFQTSGFAKKPLLSNNIRERRNIREVLNKVK